MSSLLQESLRKSLSYFFEEDDLLRNTHYLNSLPNEIVECHLKIKDDLVLSGLPFFFETFNYLLDNSIDYQEYLAFEGKSYRRDEKKEIIFELPFSVVLTAERIALNLLQRASAIASYTKKFVDIAKNYQIEILDTRKTTPGLRFLEKYATQTGGAKNHRFGQMDVWMIKDNHKEILGGLERAQAFFKDMHTFYQPIVCEIHSLQELEEAKKLKLKHLMLDNFTPSEIKKAIELKEDNMTYEISGGINLKNLEDYCIRGVDAISVGSITYNAPHVDLSLKYFKK